MNVITHIASQADWDAAQQQGSYAAESLHTEGFIHCSTPSQVLGVAQMWFAGVSDLCLLTIDVVQLQSPLKYEPAAHGGKGLFPHLYGPLNLNAVLRVDPFEADEDGQFHLPAHLL